MEQYERLRILGRGSYGVATLVREKEGGTAGSSGRHSQLRVAKAIDLAAMPPEALQETRNEVEVLRSLSHVNIVAYCDAFIECDRLTIIMEYADGGDLAARVARRRAANQRFSQNSALSVLVQCSRALRHIHTRCIMHRDLKSPNIFLTLSGVVKLGDFGIARVLEHTRALAVTVIGTPTHLPPEVCDSKPYGTKADMWALGVVFHELLTLEPPFAATSLVALMVKIIKGQPKPVPVEMYGEEVRELGRRLLCKDPDLRPSAKELLALPLVRRRAELMPSERLMAERTPSEPCSFESNLEAEAQPRLGDMPAATGDSLDDLLCSCEPSEVSPEAIAACAEDEPHGARLEALGAETVVPPESPSLVDVLLESLSPSGLAEPSRARPDPRAMRRSHSTGDAVASAARREAAPGAASLRRRSAGAAAGQELVVRLTGSTRRCGRPPEPRQPATPAHRPTVAERPLLGNAVEGHVPQVAGRPSACSLRCRREAPKAVAPANPGLGGLGDLQRSHLEGQRAQPLVQPQPPLPPLRSPAAGAAPWQRQGGKKDPDLELMHAGGAEGAAPWRERTNSEYPNLLGAHRTGWDAGRRLRQVGLRLACVEPPADLQESASARQPAAEREHAQLPTPTGEAPCNEAGAAPPRRPSKGARGRELGEQLRMSTISESGAGWAPSPGSIASPGAAAPGAGATPGQARPGHDSAAAFVDLTRRTT